MMTRQLLVSLLLIFYVKNIFAESTCDDDWDAYRDEMCFKIYDNLGLKSYDDAIKTCAQQNSSSLLTIASIEEQNFLTNYLFATHHIIDNVWIGLKYENNVYKWVDNSKVQFTYWAENNPKNSSDYCAQINADQDFHGKWSEVVCSKKNVVVCQRMPAFTINELQKILLTTRKQLENTIQKLDNISKEFESSQKIITNSEKNPVPLGFVYVQLPNQAEPETLWPKVEWKDVSPEYESLFFRVEGKNSSAFGSLQEENSPRIYEVYQKGGAGRCNDVVFINNSVTMGSFGDICTSDAYGSGASLHFNIVGGEVRPRNKAVRIFKRI